MLCSSCLAWLQQRLRTATWSQERQPLNGCPLTTARHHTPRCLPFARQTVATLSVCVLLNVWFTHICLLIICNRILLVSTAARPRFNLHLVTTIWSALQGLVTCTWSRGCRWSQRLFSLRSMSCTHPTLPVLGHLHIVRRLQMVAETIDIKASVLYTSNLPVLRCRPARVQACSYQQGCCILQQSPARHILSSHCFNQLHSLVYSSRTLSMRERCTLRLLLGRQHAPGPCCASRCCSRRQTPSWVQSRELCQSRQGQTRVIVL